MFSSAENIAFGIICILAACLSMTSFPVHLRAGNVAVLLMMCWCFIGLINKGINSLAFNHNLELFWTPGCDISAVIERTWQFGLCCSCFCVLHRLEGIASLRQAQSNSSDRKRRLYIDLTIGAGIPILQIPLFYIVQPYRADVIENIGCQCPLWPSVVSLFVFQLWRIVISFLCVIYAVLIIRWFVLRRKQFAAALSSNHSGLSQKKYFRLFALAVCEAIFVSTGQLYIVIGSLRLTGLLPYESFAQVHTDFHRINFVPMMLGTEASQAFVSLSVLRWLSLFPALALFIFFGLTEDARTIYMAFWQTFRRVGQRARRQERSYNRGTDTDQQSLDLEDLRCDASKVSVLVHKHTFTS